MSTSPASAVACCAGDGCAHEIGVEDAPPGGDVLVGTQQMDRPWARVEAFDE
jgi:hypothetical protein